MDIHNPLSSSQPASSYWGTKLGGQVLWEEQGPKRPGGHSTAFPLHGAVSTPRGSNPSVWGRPTERTWRGTVETQRKGHRRVTSAVSRGRQAARAPGGPRQADAVCSASPHPRSKQHAAVCVRSWLALKKWLKGKQPLGSLVSHITTWKSPTTPGDIAQRWPRTDPSLYGGPRAAPAPWMVGTYRWLSTSGTWALIPAVAPTDSGLTALISLIIKHCKTITYFKWKQAMEFSFQNCFENIKNYSSGKLQDFYKLL